MIVHNSYINMVIANILRYHRGLYDNQGLRNINADSFKNPSNKNGTGSFSRVTKTFFTLQNFLHDHIYATIMELIIFQISHSHITCRNMRLKSGFFADFLKK